MENFEDILDKVLLACEGADPEHIDEVLKKLLDEEGLDDNETEFLNETFSLLDASEEKYENLQKAKEEGIGTQEWLGKEFTRMLEGRSEEEVEIFMKSVEQATEHSVQDAWRSVEEEANAEEDNVESN